MKILCRRCGFIIENLEIADTFKSRFMGLMGRECIDKTSGLLLKPCSSIHCFFMRFTIDAVYLDKNMKVLLVETLRPWKIGRQVKNASMVLELTEGAADCLEPGDILERM